jgi:hypothetical protein
MLNIYFCEGKSFTHSSKNLLRNVEDVKWDMNSNFQRHTCSFRCTFLYLHIFLILYMNRTFHLLKPLDMNIIDNSFK